MATTGYSKGQEKEKKASPQIKDVREGKSFSPSVSGTGKYMDSNISRGKVVSNTGGPEDEPYKKKVGQWSTQKSRYASGS